MVHIVIEKDNFAYITTGSTNLFNLLLKSFTRITKEYNIHWKRYIDKKTKYYTLVYNKTTIKVKSGLIQFLINSFDKRNIEYEIVDNRNKPDINLDDIVKKLNEEIKLRDYQEQAVEAIFSNFYCSVQLMTGSGKSEISASVIKTYLNKYKNRAVLYVVPTVRLQTEAKERFEKYGIEVNTKPKTIETGKANILTYLGLVRSDLETKYKKSVGVIIYDEVQHMKAPKFSKITNKFQDLDMCVGLSATLTENIETKYLLNQLNNSDMNVFGSTGYPVYYKSVEETIENKFVLPVEVHVLMNNLLYNINKNEMDWHKVRQEVLMSDNRTALISDYIKKVVEENNYNTVCLLIPEVKWSQKFMLYLRSLYNDDTDVKMYLTYGSNRYDKIVDDKLIPLNENEKVKALKDIKNPEIKTIFSATSYMYEGIDITNMQALFNVYGGRSSVRVKQQLGRATRLFENKEKAYIYEICDITNPMLKSQFYARMRIYKNEYKADIIVDN